MSEAPNDSPSRVQDPDRPIDPCAHASHYVTGDVEGLGGRIKERPEDFFVEEIPLFEPTGSGEHLYLLIEKTKMSTSELVDALSRHFRVPRVAVGFAGMKDKHAVTRQLVSVQAPAIAPTDIPSIRDDRVGVLWVDRHPTKLRKGQLAGNRFSIRVRGVEPGRAPTALKILRALERHGVPNRFGPQRFGARRNNHTVGRALLLRDHEAFLRHLLAPYEHIGHRLADFEARRMYAKGDLRGAHDAMPRGSRAERRALQALLDGARAEEVFDWIDETQRRFWLSAFQSAIFNRLLDKRVEAGTFDTLLLGDVATAHKADRARRPLIEVDEEFLADPGLDERLRDFEFSATGPMWGPNMRRATGLIDRMETGALHEFDLDPETLDRFDAIHGEDLIRGSRRELRIPLRNVSVEGGADEHGPYVRCSFDLPSGAFATVVLDEVMKTGDDA